MQGLVQSYSQQIEGLTIVNTRLISSNDAKQKELDRLSFLNQELQEELGQVSQQLVSERQNSLNMMTKRQASLPADKERISELEKKINLLEAQNVNLSCLQPQLDELNLQNQRLQARLKENKTRSQVMAYASHDSKEVLMRKIDELKSQLAQKNNETQNFNAEIQKRETEILGLVETNKELQLQLNGVNALLKQRQQHLEDMRLQYEQEIEDRDQRVQQTQTQAISHLRQLKAEGFSGAGSSQDLSREFSRTVPQTNDDRLASPKRCTATNTRRKLWDPSATSKAGPFGTKKMSKSGKSTRCSSNNVCQSRVDQEASLKVKGKSLADWSQHDTSKIMLASHQQIRVTQASMSGLVQNSQNLIVPKYLAQMLTDAWQRELQLKNFVLQVTQEKCDKLEIQYKALARQTGRVREEVEMWQMRNEENEQHIHKWMSRVWNLKQIVLEQQKVILTCNEERHAYLKQLGVARCHVDATMSFTDFECLRLGQTVQQPVKEAQSLIEDSCLALTRGNEKTRWLEERRKESDFELQQINGRMHQSETVISGLEAEVKYLRDLLAEEKQTSFNAVSQLHKEIDPSGQIKNNAITVQEMCHFIKLYVNVLKERQSEQDLRIQTLVCSTQQLDDQLRSGVATGPVPTVTSGCRNHPSGNCNTLPTGHNNPNTNDLLQQNNLLSSQRDLISRTMSVRYPQKNATINQSQRGDTLDCLYYPVVAGGSVQSGSNYKNKRSASHDPRPAIYYYSNAQSDPIGSNIPQCETLDQQNNHILQSNKNDARLRSTNKKRSFHRNHSQCSVNSNEQPKLQILEQENRDLIARVNQLTGTVDDLQNELRNIQPYILDQQEVIGSQTSPYQNYDTDLHRYNEPPNASSRQPDQQVFSFRNQKDTVINSTITKKGSNAHTLNQDKENYHDGNQLQYAQPSYPRSGHTINGTVRGRAHTIQQQSPTNSKATKDAYDFQVEKMSTEIKEILFDMITHVKDSWKPGQQMVTLYDSLLKEMVMSCTQSTFEIFEFVKAFVHLIDAHLGQKTESICNAKADLAVEKETISYDQHLINKRVEIVMQIFAQQAIELRRTDRNWQQVLESQAEVLKACLDSSQQSDRQKAFGSGQLPLDIAIEDFKFLIGKAQEQTVQATTIVPNLTNY